MKIRSLLLGSVAAAGLSTGAFAADLGVLTSLDVCDALGISGLTISSDTNCLQITGEVSYKFNWGDYTSTGFVDVLGVPVLVSGNAINISGVKFSDGDGNADWSSKFDAYIKFVATADSDFGPAKAVLKLRQKNYKLVTGYGTYAVSSSTFDGGFATGLGSSSTNVFLDEAYVSIGDTTVIMAGKKGSIMNKGDDAPLNWLGLFHSEDVDVGVGWNYGGSDHELFDGGHVIQVVSDLGNGVSVGAGLENLDRSLADGAGTAVGVVSYAGEGLSAHVTVAAAGVLDGEVELWGAHAGFTGTFDNFKVVLAGAFTSVDESVSIYGDTFTAWNVLGSASATFDMFTIAASFEALGDSEDVSNGWGAGGSISAAVADGVVLNVGGRWFHNEDAAYAGDLEYDGWQVAASVAAAVTESITVTGEVGYVAKDWANYDDLNLFYGSAKLAWAPGGGYTSSIKGTVTSGTDVTDVGYKLETEFKKTFE